MRRMLLPAFVCMLTSPAHAQQAAFESDALQCIPTHGRPIYLGRIYEQLVPIVGVSFGRNVKCHKKRLGEGDPARPLTFLARRRIECYLPDFDPLSLAVEVKRGQAADPTFSHLAGLARLLTQSEQAFPSKANAQETKNGGDAAALLPGASAEEKEAVSGAPNETLRGWLVRQLRGLPMGAERIQCARKKLQALDAVLPKTLQRMKTVEAEQRATLAAMKPLEGSATEAAQKQDKELREALTRKIDGAVDAQDRIQARLSALSELQAHLLPFAQSEQWRGGDLILILSEQSLSTVATYTLAMSHLDEPDAPVAVRTFAVRYGYLWERASFDLSAATVYHVPGQALQQLAIQAGGQKEDLGKKTVDYTAALCANLAFRMPRSWVHPMIQVGVAKGVQDVVLMAGVGLRFSNPLPLSVSYGLTRGKDGNGTYWAVGYSFY